MKKGIFICIGGYLILSSCGDQKSNSSENTSAGQNEFHDHIVEKVSFKDVIIHDNFWSPKIETNRITSIRHALNQASGSIGFFDIASGKTKGEHTGNLASDSDVYKIIQGAAYALYNTPDPELEATIDSVIDRIVAAQLPDGYLFTYWIANDLSQRWTDLPKKHELYCAGHMFEAAVAYYEVTGKRKFLDAAMRFADHIDSIFGPDKRRDVPGHEEIELALYSLYKATGEKRYLDLAIFFIDERGNPDRIADKLTPPAHDPNANTPWRWRPPSYMQDHLPVSQQFYAVGHAVRAAYLYSSMADVAMETKNDKYVPALDSIWNDIVQKKLYITGGIGTRQHHDEGFGSEFLLPNDQAYCETCSGIALVFWNRRMNRLHGDAKYADLAELTMYNSGISGVSLEGDSFFYTNPLQSDGNQTRRAWFNPPCCPTNMVRFLPEIGTTIYGKTEDAVYINQFIGSETKITVAGTNILIKQETNYPWEGMVNLQVDPEKPVSLAIKIRIPGWARGVLLPGGLYHYLNTGDQLDTKLNLKVNGRRIGKMELKDGYAVINRKWKKGDRVEIELPMDIRVVAGNPRIQDAKGKVVLMRGPVVYCLEEIDNKDFFKNSGKVYLKTNGLQAEYRDDLLNGVVAITGSSTVHETEEDINITAIPYYAWNNRGQGNMIVWIPDQIN